MLENNAGKVKLVFKNYPLRMHTYAMKAAMAALAANKYGKFWQFHDQLFKEQNKLNDQRIKEIADHLGLNNKEFEKEMKNPKISAKIQRDILDGREAGIRGTPTIFVNGRILKNFSLNGFQMLIDRILNKM